MGGRIVYVLKSLIFLGILPAGILLSTERKVLVTRVRFGTVSRDYRHNVTAVLDIEELRRVHRLSAWSVTDGGDVHGKESDKDTQGNKGNKGDKKHPRRENINRKEERVGEHFGQKERRADERFHRKEGRVSEHFDRKEARVGEHFDRKEARVGAPLFDLLTGKPVEIVNKNIHSNNAMKSKADSGDGANNHIEISNAGDDNVGSSDGNKGIPGSNSKIVGGSQTFPNGWPSEASIQYLGSDGYWYHFCGGSLVHEQWVVTVAHCLVELEDYVIRIVLGDYRLGTFDGREQIALPSNIFVHTYFNQPEWTYDIGMIKLQFPATVNSYVQTVGMATDSMEPFGESHECYVAGWGSIAGHDDELETPDYLQQTRMTVITKQECRHQLKVKDVLGDSHICIESDLSSVCTGDSGSPLQCLVDDQWILVGMASWIRDEDCQPSVPNVFTRMSTFNSWCHGVISQY